MLIIFLFFCFVSYFSNDNIFWFLHDDGSCLMKWIRVQSILFTQWSDGIVFIWTRFSTAGSSSSPWTPDSFLVFEKLKYFRNQIWLRVLNIAPGTDWGPDNLWIDTQVNPWSEKPVDLLLWERGRNFFGISNKNDGGWGWHLLLTN